MTMHKITVGGAPDFLMRSGATLYWHAATFSFESPQLKIAKRRFSHLGLSQLVKDIHEKLFQFGSGIIEEFEWIERNSMTMEIGAKRGLIKIEYHAISGLAKAQKEAILTAFFERLACVRSGL